MGKLTLLEHMRRTAESAKAFASKTILQLTEATIEGIREVEESLAERSALNKSTIGTQRKNLIRVTLQGYTTNNVNFVNANGIISVSGNNTSQSSLTPIIGTVYLRKGEKVILSGCPDGGSTESYLLQLRSSDNVKIPISDNGNSGTATISETGYYNVVIRIAANYGIGKALEFKPMLRYAEITDDTFEPCNPSLQEQIEELQAQIDANTSALKNAMLFASTIKGTDNLDEICLTGFYNYYGGPINHPASSSTNEYGVLMVINHRNTGHSDNTYVVQIAFSGVAASTFGTGQSCVYVRSSSDGGASWSAWKRLAFAEQVSGTTADLPVLDKMEIAERIEALAEVTAEHEEEEKSNEREENL